MSGDVGGCQSRKSPIVSPIVFLNRKKDPSMCKRQEKFFLLSRKKDPRINRKKDPGKCASLVRS